MNIKWHVSMADIQSQYEKHPLMKNIFRRIVSCIQSKEENARTQKKELDAPFFCVDMKH